MRQFIGDGRAVSSRKSPLHFAACVVWTGTCTCLEVEDGIVGTISNAGMRSSRLTRKIWIAGTAWVLGGTLAFGAMPALIPLPQVLQTNADHFYFAHLRPFQE